MKYPHVREIPQSRDMINQFMGLDRTYGCDIAHFSDMNNISTDYYPAMATRKHMRTGYTDFTTNLITVGEKVCWLESNMMLKINEESVTTFRPDIPRELGKFGKKVIVMPDKVAVDTETKEITYLEANNSSSLAVKFGYADANGNAITPREYSYYANVSPSNGDYMISSSNGKSTIQQYSASTKSWNYITTTYISVSATNLCKIADIIFKDGDSVHISVTLSKASDWPNAKDLLPEVSDDGLTFSTDAVITGVTANGFSIKGIIPAAVDLSGKATISVARKVPNMEVMVEYNNRLWGVSGNEIRASKLGDITNWNNYEGLSTDSYAATIGSLGNITGACVLGNNPVFFKEDSIIKVTVSGSGAHSYKEYSMAGVEWGSDKSIAVVDNTVIYNSKDGIYMYGGSVPYKISEQLGDIRFTNVDAGVFNNKYIMSGAYDTANGTASGTFCYDIDKKIWTKLNDTLYYGFCTYRSGNLFDFLAICNGSITGITGDDLSLIFGGRGTLEEDFDWFVESGVIGFESPDKKYITRIDIRMQLMLGTDISIYMNYDSEDVWSCVANMSSSGTKSFSVPIKPRRCDHFKYKIVGRGDAKVISISKITEQGSDN